MATVVVLAFMEDEVLSAYLGITDNEWFDYLRRNDITDEVNFWIPSAPSQKHIEPGSLWLLKLKSPHDCIAGAGVFMHYSVLPLPLALDASMYGCRTRAIGSAPSATSIRSLSWKPLILSGGPTRIPTMSPTVFSYVPTSTSCSMPALSQLTLTGIDMWSATVSRKTTTMARSARSFMAHTFCCLRDRTRGQARRIEAEQLKSMRELVMRATAYASGVSLSGGHYGPTT